MIWGGEKLQTIFNRTTSYEKTGESYELSCLNNDISIVSNGELSDIALDELIKRFTHKILGEKVYNIYKEEFPLLFKYIDAKEKLSVQVHPDKQATIELADGKPKTELWYVIESNNGKLNIGFNKDVTKDEIARFINQGKLEEILFYADVHKNDSFLINAGTVHSICSDVFIAEIQQSSNTTYRLYDYNRKDKSNKPRELHIDKGLRCLNTAYSFSNSKIKGKVISKNANYTLTRLSNNEYFCTEEIDIISTFEATSMKDSFIVLMFIEGNAYLEYESGKISIDKGETVLIPSEMGFYYIKGKSKALRTYVL